MVYVLIDKGIYMEENKAFRIIWRFNAVLILLAGIGALCLVLILSYTFFKDKTRDRSVSNIVDIEKKVDAENEWTLGKLSNISGSQSSWIALFSEQKYRSGSTRKYSSSVRNYMFINRASNDKYWLVTHNQFLFIDTNFIRPKANTLEYIDKKPLAPTEAILYSLVKSDTNGDDKLTKKDLVTIAISQNDGTRLTELLQNIDYLNGYTIINKNKVMIVYQQDNIAYSAIVNLSSFTLSNKEILPSVQ